MRSCTRASSWLYFSPHVLTYPLLTAQNAQCFAAAIQKGFQKKRLIFIQYIYKSFGISPGSAVMGKTKNFTFLHRSNCPRFLLRIEPKSVFLLFLSDGPKTSPLLLHIIIMSQSIALAWKLSPEQNTSNSMQLFIGRHQEHRI